MTRLLGFVTVAALVGFVATPASAQMFYATNNLANTNFGTGGDDLITFDFGTAVWASVGTIQTAGGQKLDGFGGLDFGAGGQLIGATSFGATPGHIRARSKTRKRTLPELARAGIRFSFPTLGNIPSGSPKRGIHV